jgi:Na+/phosphate symporter
LSDPPSTPAKFRTAEDAVWLVFGFLVFCVAAGLSAVSMLLAGGKVATSLVLPLGTLMLASAVILEFGLRRLHVNLTGKRMSPWPFGFVSLNTLGQAVLPSTMFEAGDRMGLNGRVVAACVYLLLIGDVILLVALTG